MRGIESDKEYPVQKTSLSTASKPQPELSSDAAQQGASAAQLLLIMAACFMVSAEARMISPLLPALAGDFLTPVARVGILLTAYTIPYGVFQLAYGPIADRFSRQRVMGLALVAFAVITFIGGFAPNLPTLTLLRFCTGVAAAGVVPIALAYVGDAVPYAQRQATLGRVLIASSLGNVMSAALGGIIATIVSWRALFLIYGAIALVVAVVLLRAPMKHTPPAESRPRGVFGPYRAIFQQAGARAYALYTLVFLEGLTALSTTGYLGALLFERDRLSYATIGLLLMISAIVSMVTARFVGQLVKRIGERGMLLLGGSLFASTYVIAGLTPTFVWFPIAMVLDGAGFVIAHSTLQARATELVPEQRGTAMALFSFCLFLGSGLGTYLAGLSIEHLGFPVTLYATTAALALFTMLGLPLLRIVKGQQPTG